MEEDAYAIRAIASAGLPALVSNSFSKIFSLYGERVGGLSVLCEDAEAAGRVLGQLKATVFAATTPARRILVRRWWLRC
ncbi:aromatic amino acid aminotransferase [Escherichia coli]|nr:aromatic amino acid aminotransferase [Escherichia coli]